MDPLAGQGQDIQQRVRGSDQPIGSWKVTEEAHLFAGNRLTATKGGEMGKAHIHEHAEIRPQNRLNGRHFARGRDPCFKHTDLTTWCSCKNGQGHPHLTVPAAWAGRHPEPGR